MAGEVLPLRRSTTRASRLRVHESSGHKAIGRAPQRRCPECLKWALEPSTLTRIDPDAHLRAAADVVMSSISDAPLYGCVDLVRGTTGTYQLMELELIKPEFYFRVDESAPAKFARALDRWWNSVQSGYNDAR